MFTHAIVRVPSRAIIKGITTANLGIPKYDLALIQHQKYISALKTCGISVIELPSAENFPDACFIEDTAILNKKIAIITRPGALSRRGEVSEIPLYLHPYYQSIEYIKSPGTLEGGDILQIENQYYIGISKRTNKDGALQLKSILDQYGFSCTVIPLKKFLHLKTGVNYLGDNTVIVAGEFIDHKEFAHYNQIIVSSEEEYAANSLRINDYILTPEGFPNVLRKLSVMNKVIIELPLSEFQKLDGGLSCLSLRF